MGWIENGSGLHSPSNSKNEIEANSNPRPKNGLQICLGTSTTEAEYVAVNDVGRGLKWISSVVEKIGLKQSSKKMLKQTLF